MIKGRAKSAAFFYGKLRGSAGLRNNFPVFCEFSLAKFPRSRL